MRASTTREDLERNDRRGVRADDLGVPDELLHRSDDEDEWEEQEVDAGDYGHLVYDVVDAGDDPCAFEFDDDESDDDDAAAGTKKSKRSKSGARKEKPRRMTAAERAGLVDTHKAHLLCLIARAAARGPRGVQPVGAGDGGVRRAPRDRLRARQPRVGGRRGRTSRAWPSGSRATSTW